MLCTKRLYSEGWVYLFFWKGHWPATVIFSVKSDSCLYSCCCCCCFCFVAHRHKHLYFVFFFVNNYGHFMIQSTKKLFKTYFVNSNFSTRDLLSDWERSLHLFRDFFHPFETISPHSGSKPNFKCNVSFWYI